MRTLWNHPGNTINLMFSVTRSFFIILKDQLHCQVNNNFIVANGDILKEIRMHCKQFNN